MHSMRNHSTLVRYGSAGKSVDMYVLSVTAAKNNVVVMAPRSATSQGSTQ